MSLVVAQWTHRRLQMFAQSLCWQHKGESPIRKKDRKRKPQWDLGRQIYWKETRKVMTGICSAFSYLKILVHLLQLFHGVLNICLQRHAALICLPLRLPEQIHLLLQTPGVSLLRFTPAMWCQQPRLNKYPIVLHLKWNSNSGSEWSTKRLTIVVLW